MLLMPAHRRRLGACGMAIGDDLLVLGHVRGRDMLGIVFGVLLAPPGAGPVRGAGWPSGVLLVAHVDPSCVGRAERNGSDRDGGSDLRRTRSAQRISCSE